MEYPNEENVSGSVVHTVESNSNSSTANETIENREITPENVQSTSSNVLEINPNDEQNSSVTTQNSCMEVHSEVINTYQKTTTLIEPDAKEFDIDNSNREVVKQVDLGSEGIVSEVQIAEKYEEYVSVSQEGQSSQSSEYISEYLSESHAENIYTPQVRNKDLRSSEQVHSKIVADNIQANSTFDGTNQHETGLISECPTNQVDTDENWSEIHQANGNQFDELDIKHEHTHLNAESNFDKDEINNQNVDGNADGVNEVPLHENINSETLAEGNITERVEKDVGECGDQCSYEIKEEINAVELNENDSFLNADQRKGSNANESEIREQVMCSNDEIAENVDVVNASVPSSESMSVEGYTIAEGMEVTEIQEGEYTIVEGPSSLDITTNQPDEPANSEETWVLLENDDNSEDSRVDTVVDEQNEIYLNEQVEQAESRQSTSSQSSKNKPRRGRKPTYEIPMHVLGHDISKPVESVPNGRALPKPRLGVKVPYRNLTSQIVSKADIEKEVMERVRIKQEQASSRADILFARKLTQRLARKIAPSPDPPRKLTSSKKSKESNKQVQRKETETTVDEGRETSSNQNEDNSKIHNDSDLLAILEGEGEEMPVLPKEVPQPQVEDSNLKLLEREIALQQLHDLPHQAPRQRIYRGRTGKPDGKAPVLTVEASALSKIKASDKSVVNARDTTSNLNSVTSRDDESVNILFEKENQTSKRSSSKEGQSVSPKRDHNVVDTLASPKKQPVEIEPQVKVNMVLKTYSRKRKTVELPETLAESPLPKRAMLIESEINTDKSDALVTTNAYVTKSSRIIKRKVIWDPDEAPTRSPKSVVKPDPQSPKLTTVKSIKSVEKPPNSEKISNEKLTKEKVIEKRGNEKMFHKKMSVSPSEKKTIASKNESLKNKIPIKNKRSEVDKLLMDEGAVKMLYDLKTNDESIPKKKKDVYSVEKAHKEIMKKANEIKSDLQQNTSNESPKFLRKKDAFTPSPVKPAQIIYNAERKMSKDSTRSSVHTPPGSPAYSFPHAQSSMLVRRRSSSSISSSDELDENEVSKTSRKKSLATSLETSKSKKIKKHESNEQLEISTEEMDPCVKSVPVENKLSTYKSFTVKKTNKHVTIDLNYANNECYFTAEVLNELTTAFKKFAKEKDCHIVSITSNAEAFCLGLDYASLVSDEDDERKEIATELAEAVREFLLCLLKFPKVLIAGIHGDCAGLGVTMLPLFDMVIASDTATFRTLYASLGCVAEAGFLLSPPIFTNHGLAAELLYNTQKITADDAFRRGLVTRLCWPEKYNETLKSILTSVSRGSKQSLVATKKQLRRHLVQTAEAAINSESKLLVDHWISSECQKNFAQINGDAIE